MRTKSWLQSLKTLSMTAPMWFPNLFSSLIEKIFRLKWWKKMLTKWNLTRTSNIFECSSNTRGLLSCLSSENTALSGRIFQYLRHGWNPAFIDCDLEGLTYAIFCCNVRMNGKHWAQRLRILSYAKFVQNLIVRVDSGMYQCHVSLFCHSSYVGYKAHRRWNSGFMDPSQRIRTNEVPEFIISIQLVSCEHLQE